MGDKRLRLHAKNGCTGARVRLVAMAFGLAPTLCASLPALAAHPHEGAWIAAARIIKDGGWSGSGIYFQKGLVITAAHLTDAHANMGVQLASQNIPVTVLRQGAFEDVDLSLLAIAKENMPAKITLPEVELCQSPPWPGDPVIVVDAERATRSHIASPQLLPFSLRNKFTSLIADVATTGNSGSGVFDPHRKCLLGIMSRKFMADEGKKDIAKYFVPANVIREFLPPEFRSPRNTGRPID